MTVQELSETRGRHARERLIASAQELFWANGVESTSPRQVLSASGVGQGSLYHHFPTKRDLAIAAVRRTADETLASAEWQLSGEGTAAARLSGYLERPRQALAGCKVGRLTSDPMVMSDGALLEPVADYFTGLLDAVASVFEDLGLPGSEARKRAFATVAVIQGGYVLARALGDPHALETALDGLADLLQLKAN